MISRGSDLADFLWKLDHSRRSYLVRKSRYADFKYFTDHDPNRFITIVRFTDGISMFIIPYTIYYGPEKFINTDSYAERRLKSI